MSRFSIKRRKGGFTLIEIMIVVLIIGILLAIAIPNFMRARESSRAKSCIANMKQLETAKEQWAMDWKKDGAAVPDEAALTTDADQCGKYMKAFPVCPAAGEYTIGSIDDRPTCNYAGADFPHALTEVGG